MKNLFIALLATCLTYKHVEAFAITKCVTRGVPSASFSPSTAIWMGLFDGFSGMGSGKDKLDEQWEAQQAILRERRKPRAEREKYFAKIEEKRMQASKKQNELWSWQTKTYGKGEDPLDEWKKRRTDGRISDLENQYGDPKKVGGIPLPSASFGVGGEFGVGGKYDNGGRFDLRLPYADQGYVDEDADVMSRLGNLFAGGKNKKEAEVKSQPPSKDEPKKKSSWPW
jgi:hypothetical protein